MLWLMPTVEKFPRSRKFLLIRRTVAADGTVEMSETDPAPLLRAGWVRVDVGDPAASGSAV
jgi:hypothetical protein